ncbi:hypothetical protein ACSFA8_23370 [Variovorax sp. RT4R15]|uniref:hypothetical protein n=1 Tax=Variovorax sp. RT4R15 TaxID=3443737 RepID=UPI003F468201
MTIAAFSNENPTPGTTLQVRAIKSYAGLGGLPGNHIAYDEATDRLYGSIGATIMVIDHASMVSGDVTPTRVITTPSVGSLRGRTSSSTRPTTSSGWAAPSRCPEPW